MYALAALLALPAILFYSPVFYFGAAWVTVGVEIFMALVNIIFLWRNNLVPTHPLPQNTSGHLANDVNANVASATHLATRFRNWCIFSMLVVV